MRFGLGLALVLGAMCAPAAMAQTNCGERTVPLVMHLSRPSIEIEVGGRRVNAFIATHLAGNVATNGNISRLGGEHVDGDATEQMVAGPVSLPRAFLKDVVVAGCRIGDLAVGDADTQAKRDLIGNTTSSDTVWLGRNFLRGWIIDFVTGRVTIPARSAPARSDDTPFMAAVHLGGREIACRVDTARARQARLFLGADHPLAAQLRAAAPSTFSVASELSRSNRADMAMARDAQIDGLTGRGLAVDLEVRPEGGAARDECVMGMGLARQARVTLGARTQLAGALPIPAYNRSGIQGISMQYGTPRDGANVGAPPAGAAVRNGQDELRQIGGATIDSLRPGSAAERAGLRVGDQLESLGGVQMSSGLAMSERFTDTISQPAGTVVPVVIRRDGELQTLQLVLEDAPGL